jgi:site-specific DNA-methyltransferase (adenine-specific)
MATSEVFNADCMEVMSRYPDKWFELAIVDPPYGIKATKRMGINKKRGYDPSPWIGGKWDELPPDKEYFTELFRISQNQIIWGGNYFIDKLLPKRCFIIWDKIQRIDQADCEMAWTSFNSSARIFQFQNSKLIGFMNPERFHPTEKPVALYKWLLRNYAKPGDKILDTHLGSGSSRIACYDGGFDFVGCELDPDYFAAMEKRFQQHISQLTLQI